MDPIQTALTLDVERTRGILPAELAGLADLAWNLASSWLPEGPALFREIDRGLWEQTAGNARAVIERCGARRLAELACDPAFLLRLERLAEAFAAATAEPAGPQSPVAYFSAEFGLQESLPIYSGGLGVLAGDHLKAASDLGVPLVGVGLRYRQGYFQQRVDASGWQIEEYPVTDFSVLPAGLILNGDGTPRTVTVTVGHHPVVLQMWGVRVGRVSLLLLDSYRDDNEIAFRDTTSHLYGGGQDIRVAQEIVLGIGGVRALRALGYEPRLFHMNEGHAAFLGLELLRERLAQGEPMEQALENVRQGSVFTTHTPVPAGHDVFEIGRAKWALGHFVSSLPCTQAEQELVWQLARKPGQWDYHEFGMTPLAVHLSRSTNAVSKLHGEVCKPLLHPLWPDLPVDDVPVTYVTNGVHLPTWIAPGLQSLFDRHLGEGWRENAPGAWEQVDAIPDSDVWVAHQRLKQRLLEGVRERAHAGLTSPSGPPFGLHRDVLTLGFARRIATYKRLYLLLQDADRARRIFGSTSRPVRLVIAGKAHPRDVEAKHVLQGLLRRAAELGLAHTSLFVVDYNMAMARDLVQGCDVWLNLPRRPMEASGTSGMKAAANGVLNASILDGWWEEGYDGTNGWAVGTAEDVADPQVQDAEDALSLYHLLEDEIIPMYYERDAKGLPLNWIRRMKASIRTCAPAFSAARMVDEYVRRIYRIGEN